MNSKLKLLAFVVIAVAAAPAVVSAQKVDQQLSIAAQPKAVTINETVQISGALTGGTQRDISGQNVTLQSDPFPYEGRFEKVDTVDTNDAGNYSFTIKPLTNAKYRTTAKGGTQSPEVTVPVRVAVTLKVSDRTPRSGQRVKFSGAVAPEHDGKVARIQRRTSRGWKNIAKVTLADGGDAVSTYSKRKRVTRSGRYRVKFNPADGDHATGTSRKVRITVG
jgi:hypothetical protein